MVCDVILPWFLPLLHQIDVPDSINGSFYRGDVYVSYKDSILQPSSPLRHAAELKNVLKARGGKRYHFRNQFKFSISLILL